MIQRIQTLWLFISTICASLYVFLPIYKGVTLFNIPRIISVRENLFLYSVCAILITICLVSIFQFKKRKIQKRLVLLNILLSLSVFISQYFLVEFFKPVLEIVQGDWQIVAILPLFILLFHVFAYRGITADEKLLSSADRMR
jgi:hypothetical protein